MTKKLFKQATLSILVSGAILSAVAGGAEAPPMMLPGFYIGLGGAYDSYYAKNSYSGTGTITNNVTNQSYSNIDLLNAGYAGSSNFGDNITQDKFAPMVQIGYWSPIDSIWLWGLQASYKYMNYSYSTRMNAADQNFASQAFTANSVSNIASPEDLPPRTSPSFWWLNQTSTPAISVFNATTSFNNELLLLAYFGVQFSQGYAYLGLGAVMFTYKDNFQMNTAWNLKDLNQVMNVSNSSATGSGIATYTTSANVLQQIVLATPPNRSAVNTPILIASSSPQSKSTTIWGGAFQVGYNYYLLPSLFLNFNYTYTLTGTYKFTTNIANPNITWFNNPIPSSAQLVSGTSTYSGTTLTSILNLPGFNTNNTFSFTNFTISRKIQLQAQEFIFSVNKVFEL